MPTDCSVLRTLTILPSIRISWDYHPTFMPVSYTHLDVYKRQTHTIEVIFMKANGNPQTGVFVDVATGSYYEDAVDWAVLFSLQETNQ